MDAWHQSQPLLPTLCISVCWGFFNDSLILSSTFFNLNRRYFLLSGIKPLTYGRVICISTRAKVTRDDRVRSFGALILGGNGNGVAGYGYGRGKTGQLALIDAEKKLHLNLFTLPRYEDYTIFHPVAGYFRRTVAVVRPASDGRGLHAGKLAHGIMSCFGIRDAYAKLYGQKNVYSQTKAIFKALSHVRSAEEFAMSRGRKVWELNRSWIDRPARFMDYTVPEKQRMQSEAAAHDERIQEVRRILMDMGRDEQEDLLSSPGGLKAFVDMITAERLASEDPVPWIRAVEAEAAKRNGFGAGASLDVDFDDFENDEIVYADKELVDPSDLQK
jgi:small subunit ribosomal protein S5